MEEYEVTLLHADAFLTNFTDKCESAWAKYGCYGNVYYVIHLLISVSAGNSQKWHKTVSNRGLLRKRGLQSDD